MKHFSLTAKAMALTFATTLTSHSAFAQSLADLYESARHYDATFLSAKAQFDANVALADQAKAALLPQIGFSGTISRSNYNLAYPYLPNLTPPVNNVPQDRDFGNRTYGFNLTQALYRPGYLANYSQGQKQLLVADAQLQAAEQDLMIRLSQAYFDLLASKDNLALVRVQKAAITEQRSQAKRNFEVGTSTITDTQDAQARLDLNLSQEIAAENDVRIKQLALDLLVGKDHVQPYILKVAAALPVLKADDMDQWVAASQDMHPAVRVAQMNLDVAKLENDKSRAGNKPTLDGFINLTNTSNFQGSNTGNSIIDSRSYTQQAGIVLNIPLFAGFTVQNRLKQTLALEEKANIDLENAKRTVAQGTRSAYLTVVSGLSTVKALEAAENSSKSSLDSNKLGFQVGVRINIDVLNAQSQLYQTQLQLAQARYNVLLGQLKLRQANGSLKEQDLVPISALLAQ